jgi:hypothetical protein
MRVSTVVAVPGVQVRHECRTVVPPAVLEERIMESRTGSVVDPGDKTDAREARIIVIPEGVETATMVHPQVQGQQPPRIHDHPGPIPESDLAKQWLTEINRSENLPATVKGVIPVAIDIENAI